MAPVGSDPTVVLAPRDFTTRDLEHQIFGLSTYEPSSSRDPLISATCPPQMDGCTSFATSPLANLDAKGLNRNSLAPLQYLTVLGTSRIPLGEFRSSNASLITPAKQTRYSFTGIYLPASNFATPLL
jgi:hypothetical protein